MKAMVSTERFRTNLYIKGAKTYTMEDKIKVLEHELFMVQHAIVAYIAKLENPTLEMEKPIIWPVKLDRLQEAINNI